MEDPPSRTPHGPHRELREKRWRGLGPYAPPRADPQGGSFASAEMKMKRLLLDAAKEEAAALEETAERAAKEKEVQNTAGPVGWEPTVLMTDRPQEVPGDLQDQTQIRRPNAEEEFLHNPEADSGPLTPGEQAIRRSLGFPEAKDEGMRAAERAAEDEDTSDARRSSSPQAGGREEPPKAEKRRTRQKLAHGPDGEEPPPGIRLRPRTPRYGTRSTKQADRYHKGGLGARDLRAEGDFRAVGEQYVPPGGQRRTGGQRPKPHRGGEGIHH